MRNSAFIHRFNALDKLELLAADFLDYRFGVHWHDTWSIGVVLRGANNTSAKGSMDGIVCSGQISITNPGEMHAGKVLGEEGCRYYMFYPSHEMLLRAAEEMEVNFPAFPNKTTKNPVLSNILSGCARVLTDAHSSPFEQSVAWNQCVATLLQTFTPGSYSLFNLDNITIGLKRAKEYLHDHQTQPISLDDLSSAAGLSKYHLCRQFSTKFGLSPSRYQRQLRLQQAKNLLAKGGNISEIATDCGFCDQSHFGRLFKSTYGVTPLSYRDQ